MAEHRTKELLPPSALLPELFQRYASAQLEEDTKAFADATPRASVGEIMAAYQAATPTTVEALAAFVHQWFAFPAASSNERVTSRSTRTMVEHIDHLWSSLVRRDTPDRADLSRIMLPARYIVPGGIFRESYYWDSYFSLLGMTAGGTV
jgi:alpha,alpha-trehalase